MARNDHWFKFFYHRILVSCSGWKDDEFGAFVKLLIHQFDKGHVPKDEKELKRIITSHKKNWPLLSTKFKEEEPGKLINHVMDEIRKDRIAKSEKNTEIGKLGGRPKSKKGSVLKPNGYENKTHIYSSSISDSNSSEKDEGLGEEKVELPLDGFFSDKIDKEIELSEMQTNATIEFISLICKVTLLESDVGEYWKAFKIQQLGKHEWYNSFEDLLSHFRNSLKLSMNKNGSTKSNNNSSATSRSVASLLSGVSSGLTDSEDMDREEA